MPRADALGNASGQGIVDASKEIAIVQLGTTLLAALLVSTSVSGGSEVAGQRFEDNGETLPRIACVSRCEYDESFASAIYVVWVDALEQNGAAKAPAKNARRQSIDITNFTDFEGDHVCTLSSVSYEAVGKTAVPRSKSNEKDSLCTVSVAKFGSGNALRDADRWFKGAVEETGLDGNGIPSAMVLRDVSPGFGYMFRLRDTSGLYAESNVCIASVCPRD